MNVSSGLRTLNVIVCSCIGLMLLALVAAGGCSNKSSTTPAVTLSPTPAPSISPPPSPSPTPTPLNFVAMAYASIAPTTDPLYGQIDGYTQLAGVPTASPAPVVVSGKVTVHCNQTIQFYNLDRSLPHTASLLGVAAGTNWPATFNNVNGATVASPVLTPITTAQFSTGTLAAFGSGFSSTSKTYGTGSTAGSFYFGDFYDYKPVPPASPQMRTVITVLCP